MSPTQTPPVCADLLQAPAQRLVEYLTDEVQDAEQGLALMRALLDTDVTKANSVLCHLYDIACYQVGMTCFASTAPADEHDKWFVSTRADDNFPQVDTLGLYDSQQDAQAAAVRALQLKEIFFGEVPSPLNVEA